VNRRTKGHRQEYTQLLVTSVDNGAGQKLELSADERKTRLGKFQSHLKPRGQGHTAPILGSRKRLAAAKAKKAAQAEEARHASIQTALPAEAAPSPEDIEMQIQQRMDEQMALNARREAEEKKAEPKKAATNSALGWPKTLSFCKVSIQERVDLGFVLSAEHAPIEPRL